MRISIVTDAWHPQVNGVVRTLSHTTDVLARSGDRLQMVTAAGRPTFGLPTYPEIRLAMVGASRIGAELAAFAPDAVHIATEGTLGLAARRFCLRHELPFTTGYHTRFPEMIRMRLPRALCPATAEDWVHRWFRWFHGPSRRILVPTPSMASVLESKGFENVVTWTRGVDQRLFHPRKTDGLAPLRRPIALYAGRVAVEKDLPDFLDLDLPGSKVVVGGGPMLGTLKARYPHVTFLGYLQGEALAAAMAAADVFVFPSKTDTFGLVMVEALASGVPVAAYDVPGPRDIVTKATVGALARDGDLKAAVTQALSCSPKACRAHGLTFNWERAADQLRTGLVRLSAMQRDHLQRLSLTARSSEHRTASSRPPASSPAASK